MKIAALLLAAAAVVPPPSVWMSKDAKTIVAGSPDDKSLRSVKLAVRAIPDDVHFDLRDGRKEWTWDVPGRLLRNVSLLRVPPGKYRLTLSAPHRFSEWRVLDVTKDLSVPEFVLVPQPVLSGSVITRKDDKDVAVAGAQIVREDGKRIASTDEQGAFRGETGDPAPEEIVVLAPGFGSKIVPLAKPLRATDLGAIRVGPAVKLTLRIARLDELNARTLHVRLFEKSPQRYENTLVKTVELAPRQVEVAFPDLTQGTYYAVVDGSGPLEHLSSEIKIESDADVVKEIEVAPFRLEGSARIGDKPAAAGTIEISLRQHTWRARIPVDDAGHFGGTMWQTGKVYGFLNAGAVSQPVDSPELGTDPSVWDIKLKDRFITGRITDKESGEPIGGLRMHVTIIAGRLRGGLNVEADASGKYSVMAVPAGTYELFVSAPEHDPETYTVTIADEDESKTHDFALVRGVEVHLELVWQDGEPVRAAQLLEGIGIDGHNARQTWRCDAAGHATITMPPHATETIYVLPRDGSFAVAHVSPPDDGRPVSIVVPRPAGSLRVKLERKVNFGTHVVLRFNGELVLLPALLELPHEFDAASVLFRTMPAGSYEVWSVMMPVDTWPGMRVPSRPPVRVGLNGGEVVVAPETGPLE